MLLREAVLTVIRPRLTFALWNASAISSPARRQAPLSSSFGARSSAPERRKHLSSDIFRFSPRRMNATRNHAARRSARRCETRHVENPVPQIPRLSPGDAARPAMAGQDDHQTTDLDEHRSARRKPGSLRTDGRGTQAAHVRNAGEDRLQGNRGGVPVRVRHGFRVHPETRRGEPRTGRCANRSSDAGAARTDRAHDGLLAWREKRDRACLQRGRAQFS